MQNFLTGNKDTSRYLFALKDLRESGFGPSNVYKNSTHACKIVCVTKIINAFNRGN